MTNQTIKLGGGLQQVFPLRALISVSWVYRFLFVALVYTNISLKKGSFYVLYTVLAFFFFLVSELEFCCSEHQESSFSHSGNTLILSLILDYYNLLV